LFGRTFIILIPAILFGILVAANLAFAVDKSGVTPNAISLPSGPGSIEGLGESFQPTLNTGTAKYRVALTLPPGTAGHAPELSLQYDGGGSNGVLGFGWTLGIPFVQRQSDKGIPRYVDAENKIDDDGDGAVDEPDEQDVFINELKEELVPDQDGDYFCENEGPFVRYRRVEGHWEGTMPDGTRMEFGLTSGGRIVEAGTARVYCWLLEKETDTNGNTIVYSYTSFPGDKNANQRYLSEIRYGPGAPEWENFHFVAFQYEDRSDWFEDCRAGFVVRTGKRITEIVVGTQGPSLPAHASGDLNGDGKPDHLNRRYRLTYGGHSHWSLLTSVTWIGADDESIYPPLVLGYTAAALPDALTLTAAEIIGSLDEPFQVMDNGLVDLLDLNGDGLPDILKTGGGQHTAYLNQGEVEQDGGRAIQWSPLKGVEGDQLAWNIDLQNTSNAIAHLADMDGDGLADLVYRTLAGDVYYFRNQGNLSWGSRSPMNIDPSESAPPSPFGVPNVKTADLDFDKRMDIVQSIDVGGAADYRIWFNLGDRCFSRSVTLSQPHGFNLSARGVQIADFNGDRLPDIFRVTATGLEVTAGLGHGRFTAMVFVPIPDYTLDVEQPGQVEKARLQDITGDGLTDLVIERAVPGELWYWANLGNYTLDKRRKITGMPTGLGTNPEIRWADMNGNGTTDLVYSDSSMVPRIQVVDMGKLTGCVPSPNMLVGIDNGIGRKTTIQYGVSTQYMLDDFAGGRAWPDPLPFPIQVVSRVTVDDSLGDRYITEYKYHEGYYDGEEKEFRGFAAVEVREIGDPSAPDLIMAYGFHTGAEVKALKGKAHQIEARTASGEIFYRLLNTWSAKALLESATGDGKTVRFPFLEARTREILEKANGASVQIKWEYEYDDYGNITKQVEHGRTDPDWDDERVTETSYTSGFSSGLEKWILRNVVTQTTSDESGSLSAQRRNYYDGKSALGEVSEGNLTRTEGWVTGQEYVVSARYDFDTYGNMSATYDPMYGTAKGHYRQIAYDASFHTHPVQELIHTGNDQVSTLIFSATYDPGFGIITSSTEFNGDTTTYGYDVFGRLTSVTKPPDTHPTTAYDYVLAHGLGGGRTINWIETRQPDGSSGDGLLHVRTFYDGLGRRIMTRSECENPQEVIVAEAVEFNARMMPRKSYLPYFETGTLDYVEPDSNADFTEYFHDALGREVRVNRPIVSGSSVFGTTEYAPLSRTVRDENQTNHDSPHFGSYRIFVEDGLPDQKGNGRLREVYDVVKIGDDGESLSQPVEWVTRYGYDLLDNITDITDPQGNRRIFQYDGLSRMTHMNDPDRGKTTYIYDTASNLVETIDAKGQRVLYRYDGINRLVSEDYLDDSFSFSAKRSPDVTYFYDMPAGAIDLGDGTQGTAVHTKGSLAWVRDLSGEEHLSYDERGRVAWVVKRVEEPFSGLLVGYKTEFEFDSLDRLKSLRYPDNDMVYYSYNTRGHIERISGGVGTSLVPNLDYNAKDQVTQCDFGNGVRTRWQYDSRLRLAAVETHKISDPSNPLLSYRYSYDGVSNIKQIKDLRPVGVAAAGDPRRNTQSFGYDDLYRLTSVTYSFAAAAQPDGGDGTISYAYDRIGNMLSKSSGIVHQKNGFSVTNVGQMSYGGISGRFNRHGRSTGDPPGPHALTATDNGTDKRVIVYDENGNVTDLDERKFTWDFKDRMVKMERSGTRADYVYDYKNRRVLKKVSFGDSPTGARQSVSVYPFRYFEIRNDQPVKYVYFDNLRIARVTGTLDESQPRVQRLVLNTGWNLAAVAVSAENGLSNVNGIDKVYGWDREEKEWKEITATSPLAQGQVLWLHAGEPVVLNLKGTYENPALPQDLENGDLYGNSGFAEIPLEDLPVSSSLWFFSSAEKKWTVRFSGDASFLSDGPKSLSAGQAVFVQSDHSAKVRLESHPASILYYHKDHLGSSTLTTNGSGDVHSEEYYYPFGESRVIAKNSVPEVFYGFIDKEQDLESGNYYVDARYYNPILCRFLSVEPLLRNPAGLATEPLSVHAYAYARNNPIYFLDTNGMEYTPHYEKYKTPGDSVRDALGKMHEDSMSKNDRNRAKQMLDKQPGRKMKTESGEIIGLTEEGHMYQGESEDKITDATIDGSDAYPPFSGSLSVDAQGSKNAKQTTKDLKKHEQKKAQQVAPTPTPKARPKTNPPKRPNKPAGSATPPKAPAAEPSEEVVGMSHEVFPLAGVDPDYAYYGSFDECVEYEE